MTAGQYPTSLVSKLALLAPIPLPGGYYRSKLFIAPYAINSLVAAAGPLLSLLERLCLSTSLPPVEDIRDNIEHELHAFHSKLDASQYPMELITIARYLLTVTLDELLGKSYLRVYKEAPQFKAFTQATSDGGQPQQRFFELLAYVKERPNQYLDVIELIYFCLTAGFEGEYHQQAGGRQALENHIEEMYQTIEQHRFNKTLRLFPENPLPKTQTPNYKPSLIATTAAISLLMLSFLTSRVILENKAKSVLFGYTQLASLSN